MSAERPERPDWPDAFAEICDRHRGRLVRWLTSLFGARDAEDIAQETLARLYVRPDLLDPEADAWPWLSVVARNVGRDVARRNAMSSAVAHDELETLPGDAVVFDQVAARADADLLASALRRLGARDRALIRLRDVEGASVADIAATMQTNENAIRQQLYRARRRLADAYLSLGGDRPLGLVATIGLRLRELLFRSSGAAHPLATAAPALGAVLPSIALVTGGLLAGSLSGGADADADAGTGTGAARTAAPATTPVASSSAAADGAGHGMALAAYDAASRRAGTSRGGAAGPAGPAGSRVDDVRRGTPRVPIASTKHGGGPAEADIVLERGPLNPEEGRGSSNSIWVTLPVVGTVGTEGYSENGERTYGPVCREVVSVCDAFYGVYDEVMPGPRGEQSSTTAPPASGRTTR